MKKASKLLWIVPIAALLLSACTIHIPKKFHIKKAHNIMDDDAETLMESLKNKDSQLLKGMFSEYIKDHYSELDDDIDEIISFIDGNIVSCDTTIIGTPGYSKDEFEYIYRYRYGEINNIITDNGNHYALRYYVVSEEKNKLDHIGIYEICIENQSQYQVNISSDTMNEIKYITKKYFDDTYDY